LLNRRDRIALAKYELTGDFCCEEPDCGSIAMFDCPDGTQPRAVDETVFSALLLVDILEQQDQTSPLHLVALAERLVLQRMTQLHEWASLGAVEVLIHCTPVENAIAEIASYKPWTMSWSNLPDYFKAADFHKMARACSIHGDTVHYSYSMNWTASVKGTCLLDFAGKEFTEIRRKTIKQSLAGLQLMYTKFGWDKYLRFPPPENPFNFTSFCLEMMHYKPWAKHWFTIARDSGPCQVGNVEHAMYSPLSPHGSSTCAFTWTYDPEMNLTAVGGADVLDTL
jgi:hypothetical protein